MNGDEPLPLHPWRGWIGKSLSPFIHIPHSSAMPCEWQLLMKKISHKSFIMQDLFLMKFHLFINCEALAKQGDNALGSICPCACVSV